MKVRSDLALLGLAVVGVLAELACVLTGHTPPGLFDQVTLVGVAGAAGVAIPHGQIAAGPACATCSAASAVSVPDPAAVSPGEDG